MGYAISKRVLVWTCIYLYITHLTTGMHKLACLRTLLGFFLLVYALLNNQASRCVVVFAPRKPEQTPRGHGPCKLESHGLDLLDLCFLEILCIFKEY